MVSPIEPQIFREVLGNYPTGVSAITAMLPGGEAAAMVVGTFTAVSLDPPLVAFLPTRTSSSYARLRTASRFAVNVLAHDQEDLCRRLAASTPDKMQREQWTLSAGGHPVLDGVVAVIECDVHSVVEAGDHDIVLGAVTSLQTMRPAIPLLFFRGGYGGFAPAPAVLAGGDSTIASAVHRAQIIRDRLDDISRALKGEVSVFARVDNDDVAVASVPAEGAEPVTAMGTRHPLVPPLGVPLIAWSDSEDQEAWIDRAVGATESERESFRNDLADARQWGWSVAVHDASIDDTSIDDSELVPPARQSALLRRIVGAARYQDIDLIDPSGTYLVSALMAPLRAGEEIIPDLMLRVLYHPPVTLSGADVLARGAHLNTLAQAAADVLGAETARIA